MSQTTEKSGLSRAVLKQLSHPLKLRLALCSSMLTVWYGLYFSPLSERVTLMTSRIGVDRKRVDTAKEVERLKKALDPFRDVAGGGDVHELMRHVMGRIRSSPLRLTDLKPEKPKDLGPFDAIGLRLSLEGGFVDIDQFLAWIEAEKRLLRVDSIRLAPNVREPGRLSAQLTVMALAEKPAPTGKAREEAKKK